MSARIFPASCGFWRNAEPSWQVMQATHQNGLCEACVTSASVGSRNVSRPSSGMSTERVRAATLWRSIGKGHCSSQESSHMAGPVPSSVNEAEVICTFMVA